MFFHWAYQRLEWRQKSAVEKRERHKHRFKIITTDIKDGVRNNIKMFPTVPAQNIRKDSNRLN